MGGVYSFKYYKNNSNSNHSNHNHNGEGNIGKNWGILVKYICMIVIVYKNINNIICSILLAVIRINLALSYHLHNTQNIDPININILPQ